jgi:hypothetical protein
MKPGWSGTRELPASVSCKYSLNKEVREVVGSVNLLPLLFLFFFLYFY